MTPQLLDTLIKVTSKALMEGAFVVTFQVDDEGPLVAPTVDVEVEVLPTAGIPLVLDVSLPGPLAREMAANTLGETDLGAVNDEDILGTALELANVLAGGIAREVTRDGALCRIASPRVCAQQSGPGHLAITLVADTGARVRVGLRPLIGAA
jgi:hypothetical protein